MTSIIIAALGGVLVAALCLIETRLTQRTLANVRAHVTALYEIIDEHVEIDNRAWAKRVALEAEIARLTPLAEIGLRRVQADRKYKAKHRKGNGDA